LETVTEDVDTSELGKLISYIRGYASKVEAEKIRERTMRGKLARAKEGRIPSGSGSTIYGYDYLRVSQENGGRRVINETEASWVRKVFEWLVHEGLSTSAIVYRLRTMNVPTKFGKIWIRESIQTMLKNPSYTGKTYVFTSVKGGKKLTKPQAEWIEIPGVTPAIITQELFEDAQKQLQANRDKSLRNVKHEYLLHGHVRCRQCGRAYYGGFASNIRNSKRSIRRYYRCLGKLKMCAPIDHCHNSNWNAAKLESLVWTEIERVLNNPEIIITELKKQLHDADRVGMLEFEVKQIERQLNSVNQEQRQLLQWALKGFPESQVEAENKRINKARENLRARKEELEAQIRTGQDVAMTITQLEHTVALRRHQLKYLNYATKRDFIENMGIKVLLDGKSVEIMGFIPIKEGAIVHAPSSSSC